MKNAEPYIEFLDGQKQDVKMTIAIQLLLMVGANVFVYFLLPAEVFYGNLKFVFSLAFFVPTAVFLFFIYHNIRKYQLVKADVLSPQIITQQYTLDSIKRRFDETGSSYDYFIISFKNGPKFHLKDKVSHKLQPKQAYLVSTFIHSGAAYEVKSLQYKTLIPHTHISYYVK